MLLWFLLLLLPLFAQGDQIRLTLVVDDREAQRLSAAQVMVEQNPPVTAVLTDDGACAGDKPGDHILTGCIDITKRESLSFAVLDAGQRMGAFNLFLPNADEATVSLRTKSGAPALLLDMAAEKPMYASADPRDEAQAPKDRILIMVRIDDQLGRGLENPELRILDREGVPPVLASDAGLLLGDDAGDAVWRADLTVLRTDSIALGLFDGGEQVGRVDLPLPAKPRIAVLMTVQDDPPGVTVTTSDDLPSEDTTESCLLRISLKDITGRELAEPWIEVEGQADVDPAQASDEGLLSGDVADDGTFRADMTVLRTPTLTLALRDGETSLGSTTFSLPASTEVAISLVRRGDPAELTATTEAIGSASATETISLVISLDDRVAKLLTEPGISTGSQASQAKDDGSTPGDKAGDGVYMSELEVTRVPVITLEVLDEGVSEGSVEVPLPATGSAEIYLRTRRGSPAVMLVEMLEKSGGRVGGGTGGGSIWMVVWLNIGLFIVLFVWVRRTVKRAIDRELKARSGASGPSDAETAEKG